MQILFVTSEVPFPPDNGVRIVSYHAMRLMHEAGHQVHLMTLGGEGREDCSARLAQVAPLCASKPLAVPMPPRKRAAVALRSLVSNRMFFHERFWSNEFASLLRQRISDLSPHVVHLDTVGMAQYVECVPLQVGAVASINDSYTLTLENLLKAERYSGVEKLLRKIQLRQSRRFESSVYPNFGAVHTMTQVDADYLTNMNPAIRPFVIPNGVDEELSAVASVTQGQTDVIFIGELAGNNLKSLQRFLELAWRRIRREQPKLTLHVIGRHGDAARQVCELANSIGGVVFRGYVADLAEAMAVAGIAIVPLDKNCGLINKAIQSMACGHAIVTLESGIAGMPAAADGVNCVAVDSLQSMADAIIALATSKDRLTRIQQAAAATAAAKYSWNSRQRSYEHMYESAWAVANHREVSVAVRPVTLAEAKHPSIK